METITEPKSLVDNPNYLHQRQKTLADLTDDMIDAPIIEVVNAFNKLPCCFTLQSCYGHFMYNGQNDPHNLSPLPVTDTITDVEYRIAYVCLCIENSNPGRWLLEALSKITIIDPENVQFCCAEWFWSRQVNSYALQIEPNRFKNKDTAMLDYIEALHIEKVRNEFFVQLRALTARQL